MKDAIHTKFLTKGGIHNAMNKKLDTRIINFYTYEAARCMQSRASFASCVMLSSLLEYVLGTIYEGLPDSIKEKDPDLFTLVNFFQTEGWISGAEINKYFDTIQLARDFSHIDKVAEYFEKNSEPPTFDIKASQVLSASISEVIKNLTKAVSEEKKE
jgi:hypothetical protein